jgi:GH24 family phage-related lysozyme (muramidase)
MMNELRELLEADEGVKHEVYLDHLGKATTGIGHLILEDDDEHGWPVGAPVSEERVSELFAQDVQTALKDALWLQPELESWPIPGQITVVSLAFQLGAPRYSKFVKHHEALEKEHWMMAAAELRDSKLYRQTPERTERHAQRLESLA